MAWTKRSGVRKRLLQARYFAGSKPKEYFLIGKIPGIIRLFHICGHHFLWKKRGLRPFAKRGILRAYLASVLSSSFLRREISIRYGACFQYASR